MERRLTGKIRICHMTSAHQRYDGRIFSRECISLQKAGYEVYLAVSDDKPDEIKNGIHICSTGLAPGNRMERMTKATRRVFEKAAEIDAEVYHFHDPELLPYGYKLKKLGKKVIFDSHEDTVTQILDKNYLLIPKAASRIYEMYQNDIVRMLDAVIAVSPNLTKHLTTAKDRRYIITNYPILLPMQEHAQVKKQICFTGGCTDMWCVAEVAEAVSGLECEYVMAGPGEKDYIDIVLAKGKGKTKYLGQLERDAVFKLQAESAAGAMVCSASQLIRNGGTMGNTKMFEYMMNGIPIICSDVELWRNIVEKYECGVCVDPLDVQSIRAGIQYILSDPDRAKRMGQNGRKAVEEKFNWQTQVDELERLYRNVLNI